MQEYICYSLGCLYTLLVSAATESDAVGTDMHQGCFIALKFVLLLAKGGGDGNKASGNHWLTC